jgi:hypothetical protein
MTNSAGTAAMEELVAAIGKDAARLLAQRFGGTTVYVPLKIGEHHPLFVVLGGDIASKLVACYGGSRINVPKQPERRARVRELHRAGTMTIAGIALETGYSERNVYRLVREQDESQPSLFD